MPVRLWGLTPHLGDRLVMVLGIWSTEEATVMDRQAELSDKSSASFCSGEEERSTRELPESSVISTSRGG